MTPKYISHTNVFDFADPYKVAVLDILLTDKDIDFLYDYHMKNKGRQYDKNDITLLTFVHIDSKNHVTGWHYDTACYYPNGQGEHEIGTKLLPKELEQECIQFVKDNYFGNESKYDT